MLFGRFGWGSLLDPLDEKRGTGGVCAKRTDGGHLTLATGCGPEEEHGRGWVSGSEDAWIGDSERGVQGDALERSVFFGEAESELDLRVSAAASNVAV